MSVTFKILITLWFIVINLTGCKPKSGNNTPSSIVSMDSKLMVYYKENRWEYPIEIDTTGIQNGALHLKGKLYDWCIADSVLLKHRVDKALRIHSIGLENDRTAKEKVECIIDFYREGEINDGVVVPVEGHSVMENKFLRQRERAVLEFSQDKIVFSHWRQ